MKNKLVSECLKAFTRRQRMVLFALMALTAILGLLYPLLLSSDPRSVMTLTREYRPGELSDEDVIAPSDFSYIDEEATAGDIEEARRSVLPQFHYSVSESVRIRRAADDLIAAIRSGSALPSVLPQSLSSVVERASQLSDEHRGLVAELVNEAVIYLTEEGVFSATDLAEAIDDGYAAISIEKSSLDFAHSGRIRLISDAVVSGETYETVSQLAAQYYPDLPSSCLSIISDSISEIVTPNVIYDPVITEEKREDAAASVKPVLVEITKGDYIMQRDTVVTEQQLRTVQRIYDAAVVSVSFQKAVGYLVFLVLVTVLTVYLIFFFVRYRYRLFLYTTIFLVGVMITLTGAFLLSSVLPEEGVQFIEPFLPFILMPALAASITGRRRVGFSIALLLSCFASILPGSRSFSFFYFIAVIESCLMFTRFGTERIDMIYQTLFSALAAAAITVLVAFIYDLDYTIVLTSAIAAGLNVVFTYIIISVILPLIEKIFNIPTAYRLHELSFTDTPVLNRLSQVAPGTFNHSKNVSEMAYDACKAINANADLARVGGLYHDIGKAEHPEYFIENQNGKNAHDEINKTLSAAIIKSHVKLGVEKAKEAGLPQEVIDIISEHHGNDLIKYFYNEAMREAKESRGAIVSEEDFRYNGHIPSTPESAVVMLADCTEAATRTMKNPNHQKYEKFISSIIMDKMNYKQLNNSLLTINDLDKIKESFIHYLLGRDHQRIEYGKD